jgi:hypothetical protein
VTDWFKTGGGIDMDASLFVVGVLGVVLLFLAPCSPRRFS